MRRLTTRRLKYPPEEDAVTAVTELARDLLSNPVIEEFLDGPEVSLFAVTDGV